jgi:hypothetical protein
MHLLGHRDSEYAPASEPEEAIKWMDLLNLYLVFDRPERKILDGEGFRLEQNGPRRIIRKYACTRYSAEDFFYNPYGYNRLVPENCD